MAKFIFPLLLLAISGFAQEAKYTPGKFHNYSHADGTVPRGDYQYSVYVPKDYDPKKSYPLVFWLHGGRGRDHPEPPGPGQDPGPGEAPGDAPRARPRHGGGRHRGLEGPLRPRRRTRARSSRAASASF